MNDNLSQSMWLLGPSLILAVGALVMLLGEVFFPKTLRRDALAVLIFGAALIMLQFVVVGYGPGHKVFQGLVYTDGISAFFIALLLVGSLLTVLLSSRSLEREGIDSPGEYYALLIIATFGAIVFVSAAELITLFLGLETMSMAIYCLCGSVLRSRRSAESALKYFLLGSFSSAFMLYGIALLYGLTGSMEIDVIAGALGEIDRSLLFFALGMMVVGLAFKIGVVPFHFWAPDVYQGAPTPITAYMACVIKAAAFGAALRVLWGAFGSVILFWSGAIWLLAALTIIVGNLIALRQRSLKRMLAFSSIAHAGYLLVGLLAPGESFAGGAALLFYLVSYTAMTMGAFGVVTAIAGPLGARVNGDDISQFNGLGSRKPTLAALMALFMFGLAGIPPGIAGLVGKVYLFYAAVQAQYIGLTIIAVLGSAVSCYYYLRVIVAMYFLPSEANDESRIVDSAITPPALVVSLLICAVGVIGFGLFPAPLYDGVSRVFLVAPVN